MPLRPTPKIVLIDDNSVWGNLEESLKTLRLNGSLEATLSEIRELRIALRAQIANIIAGGTVSDEKINNFIGCYSIPNKARESVAFAVRAIAKKNLSKS
jgi:hypothetical protein